MSTAINIHYRVDVTGLFHGLWWCTSASVTHFYMIRVSAMSYSISQVMTKLTLTLRRMFLRSDDEHTLLEENDNELLYKTLKCIGDAYDNLCNCCSTLNGDFGFSRAAHGLCRSLALLNSELQRGNLVFKRNLETKVFYIYFATYLDSDEIGIIKM
ncbi:hypothetical protein EVAR_66193_1 [Eumeta japonica]|uniref:Uncharacterized protein n=1 Tax=Eumeta variegata TaxID=151549 RepID=A0A4C1ZMR7_EUMVA|nr:hypothetical protein EVAR_66193_1 [Eumeta japonica]